MGDHGAIADTSESLLKLLRDRLSGLVASDHVTLVSPAEIELDTTPSLAVFLYQVLPNAHLKNLEPERVGAGTLRPAPTTVDLFYLLVPYAQKREDEHKVLGRVIQSLNATPVLRGSWLQGSLLGSDDRIRVLFHPLAFEEHLRLWNAFGNRPFKLSATYLVTPVSIESSAEPFDAPPVVERRLQVQQS
jgi:Pvc16 N-terminal domain